MTDDEARALMTQYADGLLPPEQARELQALLDANPQLQAEYVSLREENDLLSEALSPLHPSKSARYRLSEAMAEIRDEASREADRKLEAGQQRTIRLLVILTAIGLSAILCAAVLVGWLHQRAKPAQNQSPPPAPKAGEQ